MRAVLIFSTVTALLAAPVRSKSDMPVFVTLGTGGGPVVQAKRSQPANAVVVNGAVYLFDVGEGTTRQMKLAGLPLAKVRAIFLSHHHIDHVGGLMPLLVDRWAAQLPGTVPVFGPSGTTVLVAGIVAASRPIEDAPLALEAGPPLAFATTITATDGPPDPVTPVEVYRDANLRVLAIAVDHYHSRDGARSAKVTSYAFRIEADGRAIVFSGDTGPSAGLERLAAGADLLVCEVADKPAIDAALTAMNLPPPALAGLLRHIELDHSSPDQVGTMAARAHVKALVLTHLVPGRDEETGVAGYLAGLKAHYSGPVTVARDGDRF